MAVAFLVGGLALSLLAALRRALWGLRGFTAREVAFHSRLPVLASSSWPRPDGEDDLVGEPSENSPRGAPDEPRLASSARL